MKPYYQDSRITLYHGDCRDILPHVAADVLITDPPYGINLGDHLAAKDRRTDRVLVKDAYRSYDDTHENLLAVVVPAVEQALAMVRRGLVFIAPTKAAHFPEANAIGGVYLPAGRGRTCWGFANLALCLLYGKAPNLNLGAKPTAFAQKTADADSFAADVDHPCAKPLRWMKWAVDLASTSDETVIDPFAGSGTTLRAAKDLGRRAIGIELDEQYCEIAARRMSQECLF